MRPLSSLFAGSALNPYESNLRSEATMKRQPTCGSSRGSLICLLMVLFTAGAFSLVIFARSGSDSSPSGKVIARTYYPPIQLLISPF